MDLRSVALSFVAILGRAPARRFRPMRFDARLKIKKDNRQAMAGLRPPDRPDYRRLR